MLNQDEHYRCQIRGIYCVHVPLLGVHLSVKPIPSSPVHLIAAETCVLSFVFCLPSSGSIRGHWERNKE